MTRGPRYTYRDFETGQVRWTRARFAGWQGPEGPLQAYYAIFHRAQSDLLIPEYCLTPETRRMLPPKPQYDAPIGPQLPKVSQTWQITLAVDEVLIIIPADPNNWVPVKLPGSLWKDLASPVTAQQIAFLVAYAVEEYRQGDLTQAGD